MPITVLPRINPQDTLEYALGQGLGSLAQQFATEKIRQRTESGYEKALKAANLSPELKNFGPEILQSILPTLLKQNNGGGNVSGLSATGLSPEQIKAVNDLPEKLRVTALKELYSQKQQATDDAWLNNLRNGTSNEVSTNPENNQLTQRNVPTEANILDNAPASILKKYGAPLTAVANLKETARHNDVVEQANLRAERAGLDKDTRKELKPYFEQERDADERIDTLDNLIKLSNEDIRSGPTQLFMEKAGYGSLFLSPQSQEFQAAANQFIGDLATDLKGSLSDKDLRFLKDSFANLTQTPDGMRRILRAWKLKENYKRDFAREVQGLVEKEGGFRFNTEKRAYESHKANKDRIADNVMREFGGKHTEREIVLDPKSVKTFDTEPDARQFDKQFSKFPPTKESPQGVWKYSLNGTWIDVSDLPETV